MISEEERVLLEAPFDVAEVDWKPLNSSGLAAAYVSKWGYIKRLNLIFGHEWESRTVADGKSLCVVEVSIKGVTRSDTGEHYKAHDKDENIITTSHAQAFKRACAQHGLGLYFYSLPQQWGDLEGNNWTDGTKKKFKKVLATDEGTYWTRVWRMDNVDYTKAAQEAIKVHNNEQSWKEALDNVR